MFWLRRTVTVLAATAVLTTLNIVGAHAADYNFKLRVVNQCGHKFTWSLTGPGVNWQRRTAKSFVKQWDLPDGSYTFTGNGRNTSINDSFTVQGQSSTNRIKEGVC